MAEVMDKGAAAESAPSAGTGQAAPGAQPPVKLKKKRRKIITPGRVFALLIIAALAGGGIYAYRWFKKSNEKVDVPLTDVVSRGAITSAVEGSGAASPKVSQNVTILASGGEVQDVYVKEGDIVHKGDPLYDIESSEAQEKVDEQLRVVSNYQKELKKLYDVANDLNVRAGYRGKLVSVKKLQEGQHLEKEVEIATLADDTRFLLKLYFSYAYDGMFEEGQSAAISIPATMAQLEGTVHEVRRIERISPEGARLFEVTFVMDNPGSLAADMVASATVTVDGEEIFPYEPGKLEYFRTSALLTKASGDVEWMNLHEYDVVEEGESVLRISAEDNEIEIATKENQLHSANKTLEEYQKNLESLHGVAPIDGTVITVGIKQGEKPTSGTVAATVADTQNMIIKANVDEMDIGSIRRGMEVALTVWENEMVGYVETVSLSAKAENGVARFPIEIAVDNSEGTLLNGAYVDYKIVASQADDCLIVPLQCVQSAQTLDGQNCKVLYVLEEEAPEPSDELDMDTVEVPVGFVPVIVEIGISDSDNVEIRSGVEEGATVFAGNAEAESGTDILF